VYFGPSKLHATSEATYYTIFGILILFLFFFRNITKIPANGIANRIANGIANGITNGIDNGIDGS
jgi:hypothetical protein